MCIKNIRIYTNLLRELSLNCVQCTMSNTKSHVIFSMHRIGLQKYFPVVDKLNYNNVDSLNAGSGRQRRSTKKITWTTPERQATLHAFRTHIQRGVLPKKEECLTFLEDNKKTINPERSWTTVKDFVRNFGRKRK